MHTSCVTKPPSCFLSFPCLLVPNGCVRTHTVLVLSEPCCKHALPLKRLKDSLRVMMGGWQCCALPWMIFEPTMKACRRQGYQGYKCFKRPACIDIPWGLQRCISIVGVLEGVLYAMRAWCMYWGDLVDLPTCWTVKCICVEAVKGMTIAHTALCPLSVPPMSLSWLPPRITVTYTRSNGDRVPATVISASECGHSVSIE
jgi:hypothetical protein